MTWEEDPGQVGWQPPGNFLSSRKDFQNLIDVAVVVVNRYRKPHVIAEAANGQRRVRSSNRNLRASGPVGLPNLVPGSFNIVRDESDNGRFGTSGRNAGESQPGQF